MSTKVVIYWDIDTCPPNNFELIVKSIRDLCISRNNFTEESFTCFTLQSIESKDVIENQFIIRILEFKSHSEKYIQIVNEIECELFLKSSLILITADKQLIEYLISNRLSNPIVLIYGTNLDIQSIQLTQNYMYFSFINFENFCQDYIYVLNSFSNLSLSQQSADNGCQTIESVNRTLDPEIYLKHLIPTNVDLRQYLTSLKDLALNFFENCLSNQSSDQIRKELETKMAKNSKKNKKKKTSEQQTLIPGVRGLRNLGNTCYMNSALQCLSNVKIFTEFAKQYSNANEKYIIKRKLITIYSDIIRALWSENCDSIDPTKFKLRIGQICDQFRGFQQNDCSELLNVVLNQFHEELMTNPIQKTDSNPYKTFDSYLKDNNTFIAQNFQGFQNFRLKCECGHTLNESYDPFYIISLPQIDSNHIFSVTLVTQEMTLIKMEFKFEETFICVSNLLEEVVNTLELFDKHLIAVLLKDHKIELIYECFDEIYFNQLNGDIYVYVSDTFEKNIFIILNDWQPFGIPLLLNVNEFNYYVIIDKFVDKIRLKLSDVDSEDIFNLSKTAFYEYTIDSVYELSYDPLDLNLLNNIVLITEPIGQKIRHKYKETEISFQKTLFKTFDNKLENAFSQHLSERKMSEQILCDNCQKKTNPIEKLDILYSPNVLMIQLKSNPNSQNYSESYSCLFPLVMNFADYVSNNTQNKRNFTYDLVAVSNYYGTGAFGHYSAYAKNCLNNKWYEFNDSIVNEINETQLNSSNAYLLFYVKR